MLHSEQRRNRTTFALSCNAYLNFYDVPGYFRFHCNGVPGRDTLATRRCIIDIFYTSIVSAGYTHVCVCVCVYQAVTSFQRIFFLEMHQQRRRNDATSRRLILRLMVRSLWLMNLKVLHLVKLDVSRVGMGIDSRGFAWLDRDDPRE